MDGGFISHLLLWTIGGLAALGCRAHRRRLLVDGPVGLPQGLIRRRASFPRRVTPSGARTPATRTR